MLYDAILVVRIDRRTGEIISEKIANVQPSKGSMEDYLAPAAEYLAKVMANSGYGVITEQIACTLDKQSTN